MKTIDDVKDDLSSLYDETRGGQIELRVVSELANLAGKYIKALCLEFEREKFLYARGRKK